MVPKNAKEIKRWSGNVLKKIGGGYWITPGTNFRHTFQKFLPDPPCFPFKLFPPRNSKYLYSFKKHPVLCLWPPTSCMRTQSTNGLSKHCRGFSTIGVFLHPEPSFRHLNECDISSMGVLRNINLRIRVVDICSQSTRTVVRVPTFHTSPMYRWSRSRMFRIDISVKTELFSIRNELHDARETCN